jgi:hypothetical protein
MSILERFTKQPAEVKDYDVNYAPWLDPMVDTIASHTVVAECTSDPDDTALEIDSTVQTTKALKLWISGGTDGQKYKITIRVTTAGGRIDESELAFTVKDF